MIGFYELLTGVLTLAAYSTATGYFFYQLNEKSIKELGEKMDEKIDKLDKRMNERIKESESHWREMFIYFNSRFDANKKD